MHQLDKIIGTLRKQADDNVARAYKVLGAKPGPGTDLEILPVEPICGQWYIKGLTVAGRAFVNRFWRFQPLRSNFHLAQMKREAQDWGLKYKVKLNVEPL